MIRSSACQPWQPDLPGHAGDRGDLLSYTTPWDTIVVGALHRPYPIDRSLSRSVFRGGMPCGCGLDALPQLEGIMGSRSRSKRKETFYSIGWLMREGESTVFREVPLPGGEVLRVMNKRLHTAALEGAGRKLQELRHKSGTREASS